VDDCVFCSPPKERMYLSNELAYVIQDGFPVTALHSLVIPFRHAEDYFSLNTEEIIACDELIRQARATLLSEDASIKGFNIGLNNGAAAGQTIFHCHFHLIPRRIGDIKNPRGGVRHIIPGKGNY